MEETIWTFTNSFASIPLVTRVHAPQNTKRYRTKNYRVSLCDKAYTTTLMTQTKHSTTTEVLKSKETRRVGERKTNKS